MNDDNRLLEIANLLEVSGSYSTAPSDIRNYVIFVQGMRDRLKDTERISRCVRRWFTEGLRIFEEETK